MNSLKTRFPLYLGIAVFIITVLALTIKVGERNVVLNRQLSAREAEVRLSLTFSLPNIVSVGFVSESQIRGADVNLTFESSEMEILPSTLQGMSGFITTGGEADLQKGIFTFSAVNENPVKTGIIASFRVKNRSSSDTSGLRKVKIDFSRSETKVFDSEMNPVAVSTTGLDYNSN